jgi:hypothetical protein
MEATRRVEDRDDGQIDRDVFEDIQELAFAYLSGHELQHGDGPDQKFRDDPPGASAYPEPSNRREVRTLEGGNYKPLQSPAKWRVTENHDFELIAAKQLAEIIKEEEAKARQYVTCDVYWLLIVVDFIDSAQEQ